LPGHFFIPCFEMKRGLSYL